MHQKEHQRFRSKGSKADLLKVVLFHGRKAELGDQDDGGHDIEPREKDSRGMATSSSPAPRTTTLPSGSPTTASASGPTAATTAPFVKNWFVFFLLWGNGILQSGFRIGKAAKWWEKGNQPNMKEVSSAEDLVESLSNAGDKLVIVDFFSPGCEMNPDVQFLQVNYEEHKSMCYSLNVHVLPFFRFYRGAHGRLCSFSCTNATIKKFRDALAKHKPERCSLGPTKGLEEKELLALAANKDLSFTYTPKPTEDVPAKEEVIVAEEAPSRLPLPSATSKSAQVVTAWR
ncbi:unnamed protein product [Malus baccata var. baccata]